MNIINFTIRGNQEDPEKGNPIPYKRTLSNHWRQDAVRYADWQEYVRAEFSRTMSPWPHDPETVITTDGKLRLPEDQYVAVTFRIRYANERHGDLDNIVKSILDALLVDDKHVMKLHAEAWHGKAGRVDGTIEIYDANTEPYKEIH